MPCRVSRTGRHSFGGIFDFEAKRERLEIVTRELKPHHLCNYLYDLANRFHAFFEHCPVLQSEEPTRGSRLALVDLTGKTLALGLDLLGIEHPEQM